MTLDELRQYCLSKNGVEETFPFGPETLVYKVLNKVFLLCGMDAHPISFNVKCEPAKAVELRERYSCVEPGFHMNKKHWNTVTIDGSVSQQMLHEWIDHSYNLVASSLPKKMQAQLLSIE